MKEASIAADIQASDLQALNQKLQAANVIASREGVVTWVNKNIGAAVKEGDPLARIADLGSFKIQGSISDNYLGQLRRNMPAVVRIGDIQIRGAVVNIQPAVQNGIVMFDIQLDDPGNKLLRPNMKVDVFLVTASQNNVLRVSNGQTFKGSGPQYVFVLKNGIAEKRQVTVGMSNFDYVALTGDIRQGEVVITTDMSNYKNAKTVKIDN
jgi:HlyD family secretion protein